MIIHSSSNSRLSSNRIPFLAVLGLFVGISSFAGTVTLVPFSYTTTSGSDGKQPVAKSIAILDQSGTKSSWSKYLEFMATPSKYKGFQSFTLPTSIDPASVTTLQLQINYQGPAPSTQTWTWRIYDWTTSSYVTVGTNAGVPDWGAWKLFSLNVPGTLVHYVRPNDGRIQIELAANNTADSVDIDYEALVVTHATSSEVSIDVSPKSASVQIGKTQSFTATVANTTNNTVTWQVNGVTGGIATVGTISSLGLYTAPNAIPNPTTVTIKAISQADTNKSAAATVTISSATNTMPSFTTQPVNQTVKVGQNATFKASASGAPVPGFQWQKLSNGTWTDIAGATAAIYTKVETVASDNGTLFRVIASNAAGSVTSNTATLIVDTNINAIIVAKSGGEYTTIQGGLNAARAGQTVIVRPGVYTESVTFPRSGSAGNIITLQGDPGAIVDGAGQSASLITISSKSYVKLAGFEIRNLRHKNTPMGIDLSGAGTAIEIRNNKVYGVDCQSTNGHGIGVYGNSATPITNLTISGNEIYGCKLGQSESLVVNGNVDGFEISSNQIHDNDNIGIDCIGYEGTAPSNDFARNGKVFSNRVWNISSANNSTYNGDRSADGIYVDGGRSIVVERNIVDNCDIGIECASEHAGKSTQDITVRDNFVSRSNYANLLAGGSSASSNGKAVNIMFVNNTTYQGVDGELVLQNNCSNIAIKNNIFVGKSSYLANEGSGNTGVVADSNIYYGAGTATGSWPDAHARFVNPMLVNTYLDMHIGNNSPAIDTGINLGNDASGAPLSGVLDIDDQVRVQGAGIDIGADESR